MRVSQLPIVNIAGYRFVAICEESLLMMRENLKAKAVTCALKGTILLSTEGINSFLAGTREHIDSFVAHLKNIPEFSAITFKESFTDYQPFNRMLVRIKKEIIPMNNAHVIPEKKTAPYLSPTELKKWYRDGKLGFLDLPHNRKIIIDISFYSGKHCE